MQEKEIKKIIIETIKYMEEKEGNKNKAMFLTKVIGGKGTRQVRIKTKIYNEIVSLCEEEQVNITDYISSVLGIHIYNIRRKGETTPED